ncbi:MAG: hypothetical protein ACOXZV_11235 [Bacteroidales bacterium]
MNIRRNIAAIPGWNTGRKLVIFESDDWGSIRMPSVETYKSLQAAGIDLTSDEGVLFNRYDSLATTADLAGLFEVLASVKDSVNRPAVFTPVAVVANPDFRKIKESAYTAYYFEPFTDTLLKNSGCEGSFDLWQEGIRRRLFVPQFHGREHLNVKVWMKALNNGNRMSRIGFDHCFWGMSTAHEPDIGLEFQAAFDFSDPADIVYQAEILDTGLLLFKNIFDYQASYFAPPNGPLSSRLESKLADNGIKYLFMPRIQLEPLGQGKVKKRLHWLGKRNTSGLRIITRNCFFEPVIQGTDWVDKCLSDISIAFRWHKPAIISTHRVNYIGALDPDNRENGLSKLYELLRRIMKNWPDAEFITTDELGRIIDED